MTEVEQPTTTPAETTPAPKYGISELKDLLTLVLDAVAVGVDASKDGKIDFKDIPLIMRLIPDFGPAFVGVGQVPAELSDLDESEAAEIVTFVMTKLAIEDAKARNVIAASLKLLMAGYDLVKALKS